MSVMARPMKGCRAAFRVQSSDEPLVPAPWSAEAGIWTFRVLICNLAGQRSLEVQEFMFQEQPEQVQPQGPQKGPSHGRGVKEPPQFKWKLVAESDGFNVVVLKTIDRKDAEATLKNYKEQGIYDRLSIYPIEAKIPQPKLDAIRRREAKEAERVARIKAREDERVRKQKERDRQQKDRERKRLMEQRRKEAARLKTIKKKEAQRKKIETERARRKAAAEHKKEVAARKKASKEKAAKEAARRSAARKGGERSSAAKNRAPASRQAGSRKPSSKSSGKKPPAGKTGRAADRRKTPKKK
jgi:hypothetical protein